MFKNENKVLKTCVFRKNAVLLHPQFVAAHENLGNNSKFNK